jgi:hypothetical protein
MKIEQVRDGSYLATGPGYNGGNRIIAEGGTHREARYNFTKVFGDQYAKAETKTHLALVESGQYEAE